ncbi:hypothetical protein PoB_003189900 [Plakobranchus ocellatus]|uniref:Uncharacterized protein n=1 Tax=Plakobranchus ocellatus TaxID=259542 RepID=A0AAV4AG36_9GAST|nr:hypothetical protein PoB_003189900 [Plakobranchus ocellatus]
MTSVYALFLTASRQLRFILANKPTSSSSAIPQFLLFRAWLEFHLAASRKLVMQRRPGDILAIVCFGASEVLEACQILL